MGKWNYQDLAYFDDATMILGLNTAKEPDSMVRPVRHPRLPPAQAMDRRGTAYPTMVIEVGHMQTLPDLHRKVALYFNPRTTIQIVLAVKAGIPAYQMNIPAIELFDGDPTSVPASAVGGFNLDLWELQFVARQEFNLP
ncbi:119_t:CDS:2 [Paraglomus occultum]|uniref:119_t:CDS:1 n=1 Tax=Paraglomus occultum TaxID=144539 RepID=A0A9N9GBC6_9GLOM|nr:119_t:CDS:2 [Paraglomus occultum]